MVYSGKRKNSEYLTVNAIEPFEYLFYVIRNLNYDDAMKKLTNT